MRQTAGSQQSGVVVPAGDELPPEEQDWYRFRQLNQLANHWERPGWADGRRSYHWLLTFEYPSVLHTLAAQCQEPFRDLAQFDLVPVDTLHLTIQRVAFTDELSAASLEAAATAVRERCQHVAPFGLRIGWLAGSTGAIRLTALPTAPVAAVRDIAMDAVTANLRREAPAHPAEIFWPHVSIAYCNTTQPVAPVMAQIEALRHLPPAEVLVTSVALVELRREGRAYRWEVLERVGLGVDG